MGPSLRPWWQCCQCSREVNPVIWGDCCPDCSHSKGRASLPSSPTTILSRTERRPRAKKKNRYLYLNDYFMTTACADTGCLLNCIRKAFAKKIGATVTLAPTDFGLAIKGHRMTACGMAQVHCRFRNPPCMPRSWTFFVFDCLATDVICGLGFLRDTRTLDHYPDRLHDTKIGIQATPQVRSIGRRREHLQCWLNGTPVLAFPDTGADVSMVSAKLAKTLGYYRGLGAKPFK
jgi:hypothetical protein